VNEKLGLNQGEKQRPQKKRKCLKGGQPGMERLVRGEFAQGVWGLCHVQKKKHFA